MARYALTGGATGIGQAIRRQLNDAGHELCVVDLKDADIEADLSTAAGREQALSRLESWAAGGIDGFVTCAGVGSHVPDGGLIASVNYYGSIELVEGLRPALAAGGASVVMISSNSAPMNTTPELVTAFLDGDEAQARALAGTLRGHDVYSASKLAIARWLRRRAPAYAGEGIRLNGVAPGYIETPMTQVVADSAEYGDAIRQFKASIPVGRAGTPEDIAACVAFLLSPAAAFVCGSVLFADGGHDAMARPDVI